MPGDCIQKAVDLEHCMYFDSTCSSNQLLHLKADFCEIHDISPFFVCLFVVRHYMVFFLNCSKMLYGRYFFFLYVDNHI